MTETSIQESGGTGIMPLEGSGAADGKKQAPEPRPPIYPGEWVQQDAGTAFDPPRPAGAATAFSSRAVAAPQSLMQMIASAAADPRCDLDRMERLFEMHAALEAKQHEREFDAAMAEAQAAMSVVIVDKANAQTHSKYASYAALDRAVRPIYTAHGFALTFNTAGADNQDSIRVTCRVTHKAGFSRLYDISMPADGKGAKGGDIMTKTHATGSAIQYGMRYLLRMIFNVATSDKSDDDGNAAGHGETISEEQVEKLQSLIVEVAADIPRFLKYLRVDRLDAISAKDFARACAALEAKRIRG